jgi:serine/threonine protein phosphatase PrpC
VSLLNQVTNNLYNLNLEIIEYEVQNDDEFLVIASDGIWEFMTNEDVARIARDPYYFKSAPEAAANALVKEAYKRWKIVRIYKETSLKYRRKRS